MGVWGSSECSSPLDLVHCICDYFQNYYCQHIFQLVNLEEMDETPVNTEAPVQAESNGTNGTENGNDESVMNETEAGDETVVVTAAKSKVLNVAPSEEVPESFSDYLSETKENGEDKAFPTSVIQSVPKTDDAEDIKETENKNLDTEAEADKPGEEESSEAAAEEE